MCIVNMQCKYLVIHKTYLVGLKSVFAKHFGTLLCPLLEIVAKYGENEVACIIASSKVKNIITWG